MPSKGGVDAYANLASITVTESAANTLTYKKLEMGMSTFDKYALILHRLELFTTPNWSDWNSANDAFAIALMTSNARTTLHGSHLVFADASVVDLLLIFRRDLNTPNESTFINSPYFIKDFAALPGGGLIFAPVPLYLAAEGSGLNAAQTVTARLYYTVKELQAADYIELIDARRILAS